MSVFTLLWIFLGVSTYAQTYSSLWKQAENAEKKGQPQTAKGFIEKINKKAEAEGNFPWLIKSYAQLIYLNTDLSADSFKVNIKYVENMLKDKEGTCDGAVLHTLLGAAYNDMKNRFYNDAETYEKYQNLSDMHYTKALENKELLAGVQAKDYVPLVKLQQDSRLYGNDMLSVIAMFIAQNRDRRSVGDDLYFMYDTLSAFYAERGNRNAALLMKLNALKRQRFTNDKKLRISIEEYKDTLLKLTEENKDIEAGADVYVDFLSTPFNTDKEKLDMARKAMQLHPNSVYKMLFKSKESEALHSHLHVRSNNRYVAGTPLPIYVDFKNIDHSILTLTEKKTGKVVERRTLKHEKSIDSKTDTVYVTIPKAGVYTFKAESNGRSGKCEFNVTTLQLFALMLPDGTLQCTVADNSTGRPVSGCTVKAEYWESQTRKSLFKEGTTDSLGIINLGKNNWRTVHAYRNSDDFTQTMYIGYFHETENEQEQTRFITDVFTDRSIYRPGQTVRAMVLAYERKGDKFNMVKQKDFNITLHDANGKEVGTKTVTSNDMGTANADFVIPKGRLNGNFFITTDNGGRCDFKVEEYKRPTFDVELSIDGNGETQEEDIEYSLGDSLKLKGCAMTFSGVEVQNAKVKYTIEYSNRFFWYRFNGGRQMESEGELTTDENGRFFIPVYLDENKLENENGLLEYHITAEVTDMGGETQTAEYTLPVSKNGFGLNVNIPQNINRDSIPELKVTATNLRGKEIEVKGKWTLYHIYNKERSGNAEEDGENSVYGYAQVAEGDFISGKPIDAGRMKNLAPGSYAIKVSATDNHQNKIEAESQFVLYDLREEQMEVVNDWFYANTTVFGPGTSADIYFMPKQPDTYIYYYVFTNKEVVDKGHRISAGNMQKFHFDYKEEYGEALTLQLFYVKDGRTYSQRKDITLKAPEKELSLKWKTFRDKLQPGQKEDWTLSIRNAEGGVPCAELMAVLYDGSLEKLNKHNWNFGIDFSRKTPTVYMNHIDNNGFNSVYVNFPWPNLKIKYRHFSSLENVSLYNNGFTRNVFYTTAAGGALPKAMRAQKRAVTNLAMTVEEAVTEDAASMDFEEEAAVLSTAEDMPNPAQPLRSNFAETAFFYPHLMTDENGDVNISFTLPESLTEWKFIGLAHTEDMDYGKIAAEITARKEFMVQPNMPRFVRVGDHASIATKIINKTENEISGTVLFELIDPETEKTVHKASKKLSVDKNGTASVEFDFNVSDKYPLLICRISGGNKSFSDGEQNYLPVLTNKKYVTETVPFFIDSIGTKSIDLSEMFNGGSESATDKQMTIEYSDNPGWTVVQALESISNADSRDAISLSAALYANYAIRKIAADNPSMSEKIETWKNHGEQAKSNLEKNEELKSILLQESPWLVTAEDETEQMRKLADLFDRNIMDSRISASMEELTKLQNADGSWSWFNGMEGNYYVTATVVEHLAELEKTAGANQTIRDMMIKGYKYLDEKELEKYRRMKKEKQNIRASETTLRYLYISSLAKHDVSNDVKQMQKEYIEKLGQNINALTIYGRAHIACVLNAHGKKEIAKDFVKSLREYTVYKPDMGRYYDTDRAYYSWMDYRIPTHIAAMKAMRMMGKDFHDTQDYLNNMTLWLIRQKQTQSWDNPINTVNAVNELLQADKEFAIHDTSEARFRLNGKELKGTASKKASEPETASVLPNGYKKISVPEKMLGKKKNELTIAKQSKGISWGAVYGQYLEDFDKLSDSSGSLTVSKKIYKEESINGKKVWKELTGEQVLSVGDKIRIRHTITADRDMDFVQVHSQFAACMEPLNPLSGYRRLSSTSFSGCYAAIHDASADFFFDVFRKGTLTVDLEMFVSRKGTYSNGIATVQCAYSAEFTGHSGSSRIEVR
ncbi:MAG: MG2 domain-containing protein [Prevotellaceae bacterium]|nr:MG2 domain-containing protein [Prevotellaceae bacterium]